MTDQGEHAIRLLETELSQRMLSFARFRNDGAQIQRSAIKINGAQARQFREGMECLPFLQVRSILRVVKTKTIEKPQEGDRFLLGLQPASDGMGHNATEDQPNKL